MQEQREAQYWNANINSEVFSPAGFSQVRQLPDLSRMHCLSDLPCEVLQVVFRQLSQHQALHLLLYIQDFASSQKQSYTKHSRL